MNRICCKYPAKQSTNSEWQTFVGPDKLNDKWNSKQVSKWQTTDSGYLSFDYGYKLVSLAKKRGNVYSVVLMRHLWWNNMPNHISVFFVYTRMEMFLDKCISTEFFRTPYIQMWNQCWGFYLMIQDTISMVMFLFCLFWFFVVSLLEFC